MAGPAAPARVAQALLVCLAPGADGDWVRDRACVCIRAYVYVGSIRAVCTVVMHVPLDGARRHGPFCSARKGGTGIAGVLGSGRRWGLGA